MFDSRDGYAILQRMPYDWKTSEHPPETELHIWPHQSLTPNGFALFIAATFGMLLLPLFALLGTVVVWGLLPFLMLAVAGIWFAITRNQRNAQIIEILRLTPTDAHLVRHNPKGQAQEWSCNRYWTQTLMHDRNGPVPHYVTLRGGGREVEIGAFLSEDERLALYEELRTAIPPDTLK